LAKAKALLKSVLINSTEKMLGSLEELVQVIVAGPVDSHFVGVVMSKAEIRGA